MIRAPSVILRDLTLGYDGHPAVHHLSGTLAPGSLTAICGPNGAGKSTLLRAIAGGLAPLGGSIDRDGLRPAQIGYLPQAANVDLSFPIDVADFVATGLVAGTGLFGRFGRAASQRIEAALDAVGLTGFERRAIGALSGGQVQRLLFARLMMQEASLVLLDEPFVAVDASTLADLLAIMHKWNAEGRTLVAVLHDFDLVRRHFPQTLLLARECVAWGPSIEALSGANLARAGAMSEAFDISARACSRAA
jgi:zinc/manganese transport system ATP-binding protein